MAKTMSFWQGKQVAVLGGAALIGSHLIEELLKLPIKNLWVADDLSSGKRENVPSQVAIQVTDLRNYEDACLAVSRADVVFHLACSHGGRGYVDTHRLECIDNVSLDATVFRACAEQGVKKVVFASSACAYPVDLQTDMSKPAYLRETQIDYKDIRQPDGEYGLAKLVGEIALDSYIEAGKFEGVACRFFTVMGERMKPNHAILALIAKTFVRQEPFQIWGHPNVIRNWTYVTDTVCGMLLAAEKMTRGAVNIGVERPITVHDAALTVWKTMGWTPSDIEFLGDAPVGVVSRVADAEKACLLLGWKAQVRFEDGVKRIVDWYVANHNVDEVRASLEKSLTER